MLIQNASLYDMAGRFGEPADLRITDGKIAAVAPRLEALGDEEVFDAAGRIVTPGFIDAHSSVGLASQLYRFERADADETTDPVQPALRGVDALNFEDEGFDMLREGGVTCAVTGPGSANVIGGTFAAVKTGGRSAAGRILQAENAFHFVLSGAPRSQYGGKGKAPVTRMASAALIRDSLMKAKFYREKREKGKGEFRLGMEALSRVFDGFPVKMTALSASDIRAAVRIAEEFGLNYTVDMAFEGVLMTEELKAHGTKVVTGDLYHGEGSVDTMEQKLENGPVWEKSGVEYCFGLCHPALNGAFAQAYLALLHKFGTGREAVLRGVTIDAARLCHIDDRVGSLEAGKDADLLVWSGDPLDYYSRIERMLIGGEPV